MLRSPRSSGRQAASAAIRGVIESLENRLLMASQAYDWENVTMGGAGFVTGIITNPNRGDVMYARTDIGGAYRWDAVNQEWDPMTDWITGADWTLTGIESLATDPVEPNRVYMACGTYTNNWSGNGAIMRSSDYGKTWSRTNMPFKFGGNEAGRSTGERLVVDPNSNNVLFLGTRKNGLWKSTDYGATWAQVASFPVTTTTNGVGLNVVEVIKSSGAAGNPTPTLYVGVAQTTDNLYKSTNGGTTWSVVSGTPADKMPCHAAQDGLGSMYLVYNDGPGPNDSYSGKLAKLNLSNDAWTDVTPSASAGCGLGGVSVDKQNPQTLIVSTMDRWYRRDDVFRSRDGGATWVELRGNDAVDKAVVDSGVWAGATTPHWIGDIEVDPYDSDKAYFITGFGAWSIDDLSSADNAQPTHWRLNSKGLEEAVAQEVDAPAGEVEVYSTIFDYSGFRHTDVDNYPEGVMSPSLGSATSLDFARLDPSHVVRVGPGAPYGVVSSDGGLTWTGFQNVPAGAASGKVAMSADGSRIVWSTSVGVYYSSDNGATWSATTGITAGTPVADAANPLKFYVYNASAGTFWISTNGGTSFAQATATLPANGGNIATTQGIEGDIWLANNAGLYHSTDSGATFVKLATTSAAIRVTMGKAAPGRSYPALFLRGVANGLSGISRSDDGGASWVLIDDPEHKFGNINDISGDPDVYGRIYLASQHRGVLFGDIGGPIIADAATLDNTDASGVTITGAWTSSTYYPGYVGSDFIHDGNTGKGTKSVQYTPTISQTAQYNVYARWTASTNRATNVPIDITHAGGTTTVTVNQQADGSMWYLLGTYTFNAGTSGKVLIRTTNTNGYVIADAVMFEKADGQAPTIVTPAAASDTTVTGTSVALSVLGNDNSGESGLTYSWFADGPTRVSYTANFSNAARNTTVAFEKAGTYVFTCTIRDAAGLSATSSVTVNVVPTLADLAIAPESAVVAPGAATQFTAAGLDQFGDSMGALSGLTWSVLSGGGSIDSTGLYTAPATPGAATIRATNGVVSDTAAVTIPVVMDNTDAGVTLVGTWTTSTYTPGYYGANYIHDGNTDKGNKSATFRPNLSEAGDYEVYARWSGNAGRSTVTPIDVNHLGGTSTTIVNQTLNNGVWVLLGTYSFGVGTAGTVVFRTTGTNGFVTVDAVRFVQVGSSSNAAPTVATAAAASPGTVTATTTALSVLGADDAGEAALTYTWSASGPGVVSYSANGTNAARNAVATFSQAGAYSFTCTIMDAGGLSVASSVNVTVNQALTAINVTPATASINVNATQQFSAAGVDQFGQAMTASVVWSVISGGGSINASGLYTAAASAGSATVQAVSGGVSDTAAVTIVAPVVPAAPSNLTAVKTKLKAKLTWADNSSNETGFHVWSSRDGVNWLLMTTVGAGVKTYTSSNLARGLWYFKVTSYNANGDSAASNIASLVI